MADYYTAKHSTQHQYTTAVSHTAEHGTQHQYSTAECCTASRRAALAAVLIAEADRGTVVGLSCLC